MGDVVHGWYAGHALPVFPASPTKGTIEVSHVVVILTLSIDEPTEVAFLEAVATIDSAGVVIAGLTRHIDEVLLVYRVYDLRNLFQSLCYWHGTVDVLSCPKRLYDLWAMKLALSKERDGIDICRAQLVQRAEGLFNPEVRRVLADPLRA